MTKAFPYLTTAQAAELAGITPGTLRDYVAKGLAPKPIVRGYYDPAEIRRWMENRPGRGARTDLRKKKPRQSA